MDLLAMGWMAAGAIVLVVAIFVARLAVQISRYRLLRCPGTEKVTLVGVLQVSSGDGGAPTPVVHDCPLWPGRSGCGQGCLERYHEIRGGIPISVETLRLFNRR